MNDPAARYCESFTEEKLEAMGALLFNESTLNGNGLLHVGIVSDRRLANGTPLVLHNIARGTREENLLFQHAIIGHYRMP